MANLRQGRLIWLSLFILSILIYLPSCQAQGGISLSHTRIIFDAQAKNSKVTMINSSDRVYLINSRVLSSADDPSSDAEKMPFMVVPPLFRLEAQSRNALVITRNDTSALPNDRESVFYLSLLAIPSVPKSESAAGEGEWSQSQVSFGIRNVIKLFYRPTDLKPSSADAAKKLVFSKQNQGLLVRNPTPYYQTLASLNVNGEAIDVREHGAMIAPFSETCYPFNQAVNNVRWTVINDYGALSEEFRWSR